MKPNPTGVPALFFVLILIGIPLMAAAGSMIAREARVGNVLFPIYSLGLILITGAISFGQFKRLERRMEDIERKLVELSKSERK